MRRAVLAIVLVAAIILSLWTFVSGGPFPWVSEFTAKKYCQFRHFPSDYAVCNENDYQNYPESCVNGQRRLCSGRWENNQCIETEQNRFDECLNYLTYFKESKNYCNLMSTPGKRTSCLSR